MEGHNQLSILSTQQNRTRSPYPLKIGLRMMEFTQHILPFAIPAIPAVLNLTAYSGERDR
jgi:hypothetical protein